MAPDQIITLMQAIARDHAGNPAMRDRVLIDLHGELVGVRTVELADVTDQCVDAGCHCAYGSEQAADDAPEEGVHFAVIITAHLD